MHGRLPFHNDYMMIVITICIVGDNNMAKKRKQQQQPNNSVTSKEEKLTLQDQLGGNVLAKLKEAKQSLVAEQQAKEEEKQAKCN